MLEIKFCFSLTISSLACLPARRRRRLHSSRAFLKAVFETHEVKKEARASARQAGSRDDESILLQPKHIQTRYLPD